MPDYSGYAQRQQQDPNLAAWANISGNLANIFGLDPAKAAEARRGIQQEDYNEMRNQAYLRQRLANQRMGELLKRLNPATGEFDNPADYGEYAGIAGELGSAPNAHYGTGFHARQLSEQLDAEDRRNTAIANRTAAINAAREASDEARARAARAAAEQKELAREYALSSIMGGKGVAFNPSNAMIDLRTAMQGQVGPDGTVVRPGFTSQWTVYKDRTLPPDKIDLPENRIINPEYTKWLNENGYANIDPVSGRLSGDATAALGHATDMLGQLYQLPSNHPFVQDMALRLLANQVDKHKERMSASSHTASSYDELLSKYQNDPKASSFIVKIPVQEEGSSWNSGYKYRSISRAKLAKMFKDTADKKPISADHPAVLFGVANEGDVIGGG